MELIFGQLITHDKMKLVKSLLLCWFGNYGNKPQLITLPVDQLSSNFIIGFFYSFEAIF